MRANSKRQPCLLFAGELADARGVSVIASHGGVAARRYLSAIDVASAADGVIGRRAIGYSAFRLSPECDANFIPVTRLLEGRTHHHNQKHNHSQANNPLQLV